MKGLLNLARALSLGWLVTSYNVFVNNVDATHTNAGDGIDDTPTAPAPGHYHLMPYKELTATTIPYVEQQQEKEGTAVKSLRKKPVPRIA